MKLNLISTLILLDISTQSTIYLFFLIALALDFILNSYYIVVNPLPSVGQYNFHLRGQHAWTCSLDIKIIKHMNSSHNWP